MPKLPPAKRRELMDALLDAFPDQDALSVLVFRYLDANIADFGGKYAIPEVIVQKMITAAEARNAVNRLIAAARAGNPDSPLVIALSPDFAPATARSGGFEVLLNRRNPAMDVKVLLDRLSQVEGQVGLVEYEAAPDPVPLGTAFLVAHDMVLTNQHVLQQLAVRNVPIEKARVRFDFATLPDGGQSLGRAVPLAANPIVDESPPSPTDLQVPLVDVDPARLDYALLRLDEPVGHEPRGPKGAQAGPPRKWITKAAPLPAVDDPLWIMQHPAGKPIKLAFSEKGISGINGNQTRFRHRVNTEPGSSGSPCFNHNIELVGMHHYGDSSGALPYNQALPIAPIIDRLSKAGRTVLE